jgi:hypothetical protein
MLSLEVEQTIDMVGPGSRRRHGFHLRRPLQLLFLSGRLVGVTSALLQSRLHLCISLLVFVFACKLFFSTL